MRGIIDIVVGLVFIVGGLTGKLVLIGTNSSPMAVVVGVALLAVGIWRMLKGRRQA